MNGDCECRNVAASFGGFEGSGRLAWSKGWQSPSSYAVSPNELSKLLQYQFVL